MSIFNSEDKPSKKRRGKWIVLLILGLVALYVVCDGYLFNKIEPQTSVAVYEPGKPGIRAMVNDTDSTKRMWKWPRILGTSIGVTEEPIKLEPKTTTINLDMGYTADEVTGNPEDEKYAQAYKVVVEIEVKDWQRFFEEIDLDEINEQKRKTQPFPILAKDRFEAVAYPIASIVRNGEMTDAYGKATKTEKGYPVMNLFFWQNWGQSELLTRRNIVICIMDAFGLKEALEIKEYLKEREPWLYFSGVSTLEQLADQNKKIRETIQSPLTRGLTWKGGRKRFVFGTERLELFAKAHKAIEYEGFLMTMKSGLEVIAQQRKDFIKELDESLYNQAQQVVNSFEDWMRVADLPNLPKEIKYVSDLQTLSQAYQGFLQAAQSYFQANNEVFQIAAVLLNLRWQEGNLEWQKSQWDKILEEELIPFFKYYSSSNEEFPMMIRRITVEQNEALWDAAIANVLEGEDISSYSSFLTHEVEKNETLAEIIKKYPVGWQALFGPGVRGTVISMISRSLDLNKRVEFSRMILEASESGDYSKVYEFAKDIPLKPVQAGWGKIILIDKVKEYSPEYFELDKENREQREKIIKRYLYKWIEEFAPKAVEEYVAASPWTNYIERLYGVEILDVKLEIEKDELFTKAGQPKEEYYRLYFSKYGNNLKLEEEGEEK